MKIKAAHIIPGYLKELGVHHIFGVVGHSTLVLTDAIYQEPDIDYIPAQFELSAAYMADGYARANRSLGVCLASAGAGVTTLATGIAQSFKESVPVLAVGSDVHQHLAGKGASSLHEIPQVEMFKPITKWSGSIKRAEDTLEILRTAVAEAIGGRKGPVFLNVPDDVQSVEVNVPDPPWAKTPNGMGEVDFRLIEKAAEIIQQAVSPIIIAGGGVHWSCCEKELVELADLLSAPIGTTPSHKGIIPETHPLSLGVLGVGAFPFANRTCQESDLVFAVGITFSETLTLKYGYKVIPQGAKIIQIDIDPTEIGKTYPVQVGIPGDARLVLLALLDHLRAAGSRKTVASDRLRKIVQEKDQWMDELVKRGQTVAGPINRWHIFHALQETLRSDTTMIVESVTMDMLQRFVAGSKIYHGGDFRAIGNVLSTAVGMKYSGLERAIVCVGGDGSFMMQIHDLATAMNAGFPILFIVVNNSAYGGMKRDQIRNFGGRVVGTELKLPDLRALAASFGAYAERVENPSDLVPAIRAAIGCGKLAVLDVHCPVEGI